MSCQQSLDQPTAKSGEDMELKSAAVGCAHVSKIDKFSLSFSWINFRFAPGVLDNKMWFAENIRASPRYDWPKSICNQRLMSQSLSNSGSCCETLLIRFGMSAATEMGERFSQQIENIAFEGTSDWLLLSPGESFYTFHSTVTACITTTLILLLSYIVSWRTFGLIRQSIFVSRVSAVEVGDVF